MVVFFGIDIFAYGQSFVCYVKQTLQELFHKENKSNI